MSSENEMIDHPGDDEPEIEPEVQQPDPAETTTEPAPETVASVEETEDGWEAWIGADPEEEEVVESSSESVAEQDAESSHEETTEAAAEQIAEPNDEETTETAAEQIADQSQKETTETAVEQHAEPNGEEATEAIEEPETVSETDAEPVEQEREESPTPVEAEALEDAADESEEADADKPEPPAPKPPKPKKVRRDGLTTEHVITYFAPCGRCGFFLSGYRATYGLDDLETAVSEAKSGWLTLTWGQEMRELILKSYGSRIEPTDLLFDGCCSECRRAFVFKSARSEKKPATFRIEIKPRKRQ